MKSKFTLVLSFLPFLVFCAFSRAQPKPSIRQAPDKEIRRFVEKYDDAWNRKDTAALERMLSPDCVYFGSKGDVRSRQSLMEELGLNDLTLPSDKHNLDTLCAQHLAQNRSQE